MIIIQQIITNYQTRNYTGVIASTPSTRCDCKYTGVIASTPSGWCDCKYTGVIAITPNSLLHCNIYILISIFDSKDNNPVGIWGAAPQWGSRSESPENSFNVCSGGSRNLWWGGYQPSWGSGGRCKPPVRSRGFAPGHQTSLVGGYLPPIPPLDSPLNVCMYD